MDNAAGNTSQSGEYVIKLAEVVYDSTTKDGYDSSNRIRVRIAEDKEKKVEDLPYAFPLFPKMVQVRPKAGECVIVITAALSDKASNRFYIGPIVSEYQRFYNDIYLNGFGTACSKLPNPLPTGSSEKGLTNINTEKFSGGITKGSFPDYEDVALIGRKNGDIIIKDDEIDLRCNIRQKGLSKNENEDGYIYFNQVNPAFLQMLAQDEPLIRFSKNGNITETVNSITNIVSDKVNIVGKNRDKCILDEYDSKELIPKEKLENLMQTLHQLPYGDELISYLNLLRIAISEHTHTFPGRTAARGEKHREIDNILEYDLEQILSKDVRIS